MTSLLPLMRHQESKVLLYFIFLEAEVCLRLQVKHLVGHPLQIGLRQKCVKSCVNIVYSLLEKYIHVIIRFKHYYLHIFMYLHGSKFILYLPYNED